MIKNKNKKTVFVGVSGGVDSSVSCALLKEQGYNVVGVFIRTWSPDFIKCTWRLERRDAMRVCAHLDIPFLECDAEVAYKKGVADYMINEYKKGNTPNPDVMCNREVKFGVFWDFAKANGADYIATGHYAQISRRSDIWKGKAIDKTYEKYKEIFLLKKSPDSSKDQVYFLWTLTQDDLSHTIFPIGHLKKTEIRKLALKYNLPTATKKDSQGVCFLGPLDMKDFLKHYIKTQKGDVLNENGEVVGFHDGAMFLTLGERHGFTITNKTNKSEPLYVTSKNIGENTIIVSSRKGIKDISNGKEVRCINANWIESIPKKGKMYTAQIRYHGELFPCKIEVQEESKAKIIFKKDVLVDKGQSVVIYDGNNCLGGCVTA